MQRFVVGMFAAALLMISVLGCNALRGAGKDLETSGEHIQNVGQ